MKKYENKEFCKKCGGLCCKNIPGNYYPSDFNLPETNPTQEDFNKLKKIINDPNIAVDWWEDDIPKHFLRPAIKKAKRKFDPTWGGECIFLTETGCKLTYEKRPLECRNVEPVDLDKDEKCIMHGNLNKESAYKAWLSYNEFIAGQRWK
jgi:Fe-S-cluster containining protein